MGLGFRI
jgi:hypothetical protein